MKLASTIRNSRTRWQRLVRPVFALLLLALAVFVVRSALAAPNVAGSYTMVHDGWRGSLKINSPKYEQVQHAGSCTYHLTPIDGTYRGSDGIARPMSGRYGGYDPNRRDGQACPASDHYLTFTVDFGNGEPPQEFTGYMFTQSGRAMAGNTWWRGIPFGWYAYK